MLPWSPLARGILAGNRGTGSERLTTRAQTDPFADSLYVPELDVPVVERVRRVAEARGVPSAQIALAWVLGKPGVTAPIVGATKLSHVEDALAAEELRLSEDEVARSRSPTCRTGRRARVVTRAGRLGRPGPRENTTSTLSPS